MVLINHIWKKKLQNKICKKNLKIGFIQSVNNIYFITTILKIKVFFYYENEQEILIFTDYY